MGAGVIIKAYGDKIHATPADEEERKTLIAMYTRVDMISVVRGNTYVFNKEGWYKIIKAPMEG